VQSGEAEMKKLLKLVVPLFALYASAAFGQTYISGTVGTISSGTGTATLAVTTGDVLLAFCRTGGGPNTLAVTDTQSNTYTAGTHQNDGGVGNTRMFETVATATNSDTLTCTNTTGSGGTLFVLQYRGGASSVSFVDHAAGSSGGWTSSSFSTPANSVVVQCLGIDNTNALAAGTVGPIGAVLRLSNYAGSGGGCQDAMFTGAQTGITSALGYATAGGDWNGQLAVITLATVIVQAAQPVFAPGSTGPTAHLPTGGGTVAISCASAGTSPFYSTNGSAPTTAYTTPVSITVDGTVLKAKCSGGSFTDSDVTTVTYQVGSLTWYVDPVNGGPRYSATNSVVASCDGRGLTVFNPSGTPNQHCPYKGGRDLWNDNTVYNDRQWIIFGGDRVIFLNAGPSHATQMAGALPDTSDHCWGVGPGCDSPPVPSGTPSNPTIIEGTNYGGCYVTGLLTASSTQTLRSSPTSGVVAEQDTSST
jgi:hypothetical protein